MTKEHIDIENHVVPNQNVECGDISVENTEIIPGTEIIAHWLEQSNSQFSIITTINSSGENRFKIHKHVKGNQYIGIAIRSMDCVDVPRLQAVLHNGLLYLVNPHHLEQCVALDVEALSRECEELQKTSSRLKTIHGTNCETPQSVRVAAEGLIAQNPVQSDIEEMQQMIESLSSEERNTIEKKTQAIFEELRTWRDLQTKTGKITRRLLSITFLFSFKRICDQDEQKLTIESDDERIIISNLSSPGHCYYLEHEELRKKIFEGLVQNRTGKKKMISIGFNYKSKECEQLFDDWLSEIKKITVKCTIYKGCKQAIITKNFGNTQLNISVGNLCDEGDTTLVATIQDNIIIIENPLKPDIRYSHSLDELRQLVFDNDNAEAFQSISVKFNFEKETNIVLEEWFGNDGLIIDHNVVSGRHSKEIVYFTIRKKILSGKKNLTVSVNHLIDFDGERIISIREGDSVYLVNSNPEKQAHCCLVNLSESQRYIEQELTGVSKQLTLPGVVMTTPPEIEMQLQVYSQNEGEIQKQKLDISQFPIPEHYIKREENGYGIGGKSELSVHDEARLFLGNIIQNPHLWNDPTIVECYLEFCERPDSAERLRHLLSNLLVLSLFKQGEIKKLPQNILALAGGAYGEWEVHNVYLKDLYHTIKRSIPQVCSLDFSQEMMRQAKEKCFHDHGKKPREKCDIHGDIQSVAKVIDEKFPGDFKTFDLIQIASLQYINCDDDGDREMFFGQLESLTGEDGILNFSSSQKIPDSVYDELCKRGYRILSPRSAVMALSPQEVDKLSNLFSDAQITDLGYDHRDLFNERVQRVLKSSYIIIAVKDTSTAHELITSRVRVLINAINNDSTSRVIELPFDVTLLSNGNVVVDPMDLFELEIDDRSLLINERERYREIVCEFMKELSEEEREELVFLSQNEEVIYTEDITLPIDDEY